jgi:hypothetical protein
LYSKTEVVRGNEQRRLVIFESPQAAEAFHAAVQKSAGTMGETYLGIPFVTIYENRQELSDAAAWNDAVARCDTNQDGIITLAEVVIFDKTISH